MSEGQDHGPAGANGDAGDSDIGLYDDPLVYDVLHWPGTRGEVDGLESIESRYVDPALPRLWLEPGCGSGRYLREATRRGIDVVGFDLRDDMIEFARARAPKRLAQSGVGSSRYLVADMTAFADAVSSGRVSFAFNLINTIRHLPDDGSMLRHLDEVSRVLAPGGIYAVGLSLSAYGVEGPSEDVWEGRRGSLGVRQVVQFLPPEAAGGSAARAERVLSHLVIERGGREEHRDAAYTLRTYSRAEWERLLDRSALRVLDTVDEEGEPAPPEDGGYVLYLLTHSGRRPPSRPKTA